MGNQVSADQKMVSTRIKCLRKNQKRLSALPTKKEMKRQTRKKCNNPPSAFALFIRDVRNQLFERKVSFTDLTQSCSRKWKEMSAEEKQKYHQMAKEIRENMRLMGPSQRRTRKDTKSRKLTNYWKFAKITRPLVHNALKQFRGSNPKMTDVNREVGNQWRQLSQEEKDLYKVSDI